MTYRVNRALGYQKWGIANPWVFADLSQPQRRRNGVSQYVWQTHPPRAGIHPLGQIPIASLVGEADARAIRMERYALAGLALSAVSASVFLYGFLKKKRVT